jgi:hypothetical protein
MWQEFTRNRPVLVLAGAALAAAVTLAGCGGSDGTGAPHARHSLAGGSATDALALSHMRVLTTLSRSRLCSVLSSQQAARILHARAKAPVYTRRRGVAVTCQWIRRGGSMKGAGEVGGVQQLYVGISATINWTGAQAVNRLLRSQRLKVDGHHALAATRRGNAAWAQVDVALGGDHDPVAQYRAPTMAAALALARAATPHLLALG